MVSSVAPLEGLVRLGIRVFCLVVYLALRLRTFCPLKDCASSLAKIRAIVNLDKIPCTIRTARANLPRKSHFFVGVFHFDRFDHLIYTVLNLVDDIGRYVESLGNFIYWTIFNHVGAINLPGLLLHRDFC